MADLATAASYPSPYRWSGFLAARDESGAWDFWDLNDDSGSSKKLGPQSEVARVDVEIPIRPVGRWAPAWVRAPDVYMGWGPSYVDPEVLKRWIVKQEGFVEGAVAFAREEYGQDFADVLADSLGGKPLRGHVYWPGVIHNGLSLVAALALFACTWRLVVGVCMLRRAAIWRCAACRYDLRGISGSICPECGTPIAGANA